MADEKKSSGDNIPEPQIRHNLVNTAVNFLLNPSVIDKPNEHKTAFLRKKGLSEAEISVAYEKAENDPKYKQVTSNISSNSPVLPPLPVHVYRPASFWSKLSRFSSSLIVLGVALYGAHYIYKKFIEPLIYGEDTNKSRKLEQQLLEMMNSLSQLEKHVSALEENFNSQKVRMDKFLQNEVSEYYPTPLALRELKTEIASVKSLLLNRHQFPALPKVTPPTIPQWQLPPKTNDDDDAKQNGETMENHPPVKDNSDIKSNHELNSDVNDTVKQNGETTENHHSVEDNSDIKSNQELNLGDIIETNHSSETSETVEGSEDTSSQYFELENSP